MSDRRGMGCDTLISLVGGNPLPNYLTACALRPARLVLVYTKETEDNMDTLKRMLNECLRSTTIDSKCLGDATSASCMKRCMCSLIEHGSGEAWLNYTGGTKVMAAHALLAFIDGGGKQKNCCYLDEGREVKGRKDTGQKREPPRLRFDDGRTVLMSEYNVSLNLETLLALHRIWLKTREPVNPDPTEADAREIMCRVLREPKLAGCLYEQAKPFVERGGGLEELTATASCLNLSLASVARGTNDVSRHVRKRWWGFLKGGWLEVWTGQQVRELKLDPDPEVEVSCNCFRNEQGGGHEAGYAQFEIDVAVVHGLRSHFISCTADHKKARCKQKLLEIAVRSRQLGGDLARSALVCLADDGKVTDLQVEIEDVWGASNTPRVFGLADIRSWAGCEGSLANRTPLQKWLES